VAYDITVLNPGRFSLITLRHIQEQLLSLSSPCGLALPNDSKHSVHNSTLGSLSLPKILCSLWRMSYLQTNRKLKQRAALLESGAGNSPMFACVREHSSNTDFRSLGEVARSVVHSGLFRPARHSNSIKLSLDRMDRIVAVGTIGEIDVTYRRDNG
jgi:hypothetical protein